MVLLGRPVRIWFVFESAHFTWNRLFSRFGMTFAQALPGGRQAGPRAVNLLHWEEVSSHRMEGVKKLGGIIVLAVALGALPCHSWASAFQSYEKGVKPPAAAIDINKATASDLQKLPGIGPSLAKQIVAYRNKHGPFRRVEDLMAIKGIGFKKWKQIRPFVRVGER